MISGHIGDAGDARSKDETQSGFQFSGKDMTAQAKRYYEVKVVYAKPKQGLTLCVASQ